MMVENDAATPRKKTAYIGAPQHFELDLAMRPVWAAYPDAFGCYLVGSALERPDFRDVDIRMIMPDEVFAREFPQAHTNPCLWEHDPKWMVLTSAISRWLSERTGLRVDFQFQPQTEANRLHKGPRHAIGFVLAERKDAVST